MPTTIEPRPIEPTPASEPAATTRTARHALPRPFSIGRVRRETHDTFTLELEPADGGAPIRFAAGQFDMLYLFGVGEVPISISGDPASDGPLCHTTRAVGTVTRAMEALEAGDVLGVRGPFGTAWPLEAACDTDVVIVAGGIGLAPLRPVIYRVLGERERYGKVTLLYGARSPEDVLFRRELKRWGGEFSMDVHVTVDRATRGWHGNVGVVTHLIRRAPFDRTRTTAFVCGPEIMMRFTVQELLQRGVSPARIHVSLERNMKCATGHCGHCQYGPFFVCKDGPVFAYERIASLLGKREV